MWVSVNCLLLMVAAVVFTLGIAFYLYNRESQNNTKYYVLFYCIFSFLWCFSYGSIGITDDYTHASIIRIFGILAIDGFYVVETFLVSGMSNVSLRTKVASRIFAISLGIVDFVTFANPNVDQFERIGNWTTFVANPDYMFVHNLHSIIVVGMFLNLLIMGLLWAKYNVYKRQRKFIRMAFIANFIMIFFAIPDTIFPIFGLHAIPTSGLGSAACTFVIWYGASKLNSFDIRMGNVVKNVYNFINAGVVVCDMERQINMANPFTQALFPEHHGETLTMNDLFVLDKEAEEALFSNSYEEIYTTRLESVVNQKTYSVRASVARDDYNEPYCYIFAIMDVSNELKMIYDLEIANNAKTTFLTSISHEIRTPINAVLGFNEMIIRETKEDAVLHYADNISRAGKMLLGIINDLLDIGQVSAGKLSIIPIEYELSKVILDEYALHALRAAEKDLMLTISNDEYIPNVLFGDSVRVQQIITNLLANAIKYTEHGTIHMQVDYREVGDEEIDLIISVTDTGRGIKEENIPHLYDSFTRFNGEDNKYIEGTGVGLAITKNLIDLMNGSISVESTYGKGTRFMVVLPQKVVSRDPVGRLDENRVVEKQGDSGSFTAEDAHVLVVDDNDMNLMVFGGMLKHINMHIDAAKSGFKMLELIQTKKYDLIFLDHMMPEMDGIEALKKMREDKTHPNQDTQVIVMTANAVRGAREQYLKEGFVDYIKKPANIAVLEEMLKRYLDPKLIHEQEVVVEAPVREKHVELNFPWVEGIDWGLAFRNVSDTKTFLDIIKTFINSSKRETMELDKYYRSYLANRDQDELTLYKVKVHAMKNSALLVGAEKLSRQALALEEYANEGDLESLRANHDTFLQDYLSIADKLQEVTNNEGNNNAQTAEVMDNTTLAMNLEMIEVAMNEFDTDALNSMNYALGNYSFSTEEIAEYVVKIQAAIRDFDQIEFFRNVDELKGIL